MPPLPLSLLRTFEAAARHNSFARAATELHVTPAAVSQQMRSLEDRMGIQLFSRGPRGLTVTRPGREYATSIARALAEIEEATRTLGRPERSGRLNVATFNSFASLWLVPRLRSFRALYPEIDVRLNIGTALVDPLKDGIDVAIRFGAGEYPGCASRHLMDDVVFPVCAPSLLAGRPIPRDPNDLTSFPLIYDDGLVRGERSLAWSDWFDEAVPAAFVHMPDGLLTLQAALQGEGVALVRRSTAADHLRAGRLVRLLGEERKTDFSYWLVTPAGEQSPKVEVFINWVLSELSQEGR